jgi:hypothetical protein
MVPGRALIWTKTSASMTGASGPRPKEKLEIGPGGSGWAACPVPATPETGATLAADRAAQGTVPAKNPASPASSASGRIGSDQGQSMRIAGCQERSAVARSPPAAGPILRPGSSAACETPSPRASSGGNPPPAAAASTQRAGRVPGSGTDTWDRCPPIGWAAGGWVDASTEGSPGDESAACGRPRGVTGSCAGEYPAAELGPGLGTRARMGWIVGASDGVPPSPSTGVTTDAFPVQGGMGAPTGRGRRA